MTTVTELEPEFEALGELEEDVPRDVWERLWDEWVPYPGVVEDE